MPRRGGLLTTPPPFARRHRGANTILGVSKVVGGLADEELWSNASSGIVHMYHPAGWGGWQFRVGARPASDTLLFECYGFKNSEAQGEPVRPFAPQPPQSATAKDAIRVSVRL